MRSAIALILLLAGCAATPQPSREAAIRSHCSDVGRQALAQASRPPVAYTYQGAPRQGYAGGYGAGMAAGESYRIAEQDCLLRNGLR